MYVAGLLALALSVPFVAQEKDSCGAASLSMVLRYWGNELTHDQIARALLRPELHGIRGSQLASFASAQGLQAIAYAGDWAQLRDSLDKGRPLIVAWRLGRRRYHDVVVVAVDPTGKEVIVNDPAVGPGRRVSRKQFEKRWAGAGYWTLLVLPGRS